MASATAIVDQVKSPLRRTSVSRKLEDGDDLTYPSRRMFDFNLYALKKSAAEGLLDLALLMANASQLKYIIMTEGNHRFYLPMLSLLVVSIILQIIIGISLLLLVRVRIRYGNSDEDERRNRRADLLNNFVVLGIFVLTIVNIFISAFGLNESLSTDAQRIPAS